MADPVAKVVIAVWETRRREPADRRALVVDALAPRLLPHCRYLSVLVRDEAAAGTASPTPFPLGARKPVALFNAWGADVGPLLEAVREDGLEVHAWSVAESIYKDFGDNEHSGPRTWADGQRSPGLTTVNFLERPARLDRDEWVRRWHERISPVSERIQPRQRYVRNLVLDALTADAPPFEGIVAETWADGSTIRNPFTFYGASNPFQLVANIVEILAAVNHFVAFWRVQTVVMSEWCVRTEQG